MNYNFALNDSDRRTAQRRINNERRSLKNDYNSYCGTEKRSNYTDRRITILNRFDKEVTDRRNND